MVVPLLSETAIIRPIMSPGRDPLNVNRFYITGAQNEKTGRNFLFSSLAGSESGPALR
jgi:hypothetical protein